MYLKKEHRILLAVIVILAGYLAVHQTGSRHYVLPRVALIEPRDITKLTIAGAKGTITLRKSGDAWTIAPQGYPANRDIADNMANDVTGLTLTALAAESGNESVYELDSGHRIEVTAYEGDKPVRTLDIGKTASPGNHTFVQFDHRPGIYHAERNLRASFDRTESDLRDKSVMDINEEITALTLSKGKKKTTIERSTSSVAATRRGSPPL